MRCKPSQSQWWGLTITEVLEEMTQEDESRRRVYLHREAGSRKNPPHVYHLTPVGPSGGWRGEGGRGGHGSRLPGVTMEDRCAVSTTLSVEARVGGWGQFLPGSFLIIMLDSDLLHAPS